MATIILNQEEYIMADDLFKNAPEYCKMCRTSRDIMKKKKIADYIYARFADDKWSVTNGKSNKFDKVLLKKAVYESIPEIAAGKKIINENIISLVAPDIIELEDVEKFIDENGDVIEIETRRDNSECGIYFRARDVIAGFKLDNSIAPIFDKKSHFIEHEHYKFFYCKKGQKTPNYKQTSTIKKELYLTYEGMLRVLFASHSKKVKPFIKWATNKLFTLQMGTPEQKEELVGTVLGVRASTIRDVFGTNNNKTPCVYLYLIGKATALLKGNYGENDYLCKFGCTDDFARRCSEHEKKYMKEYGVNIELICFSIIEAKYIFDAESNIAQYFKGNILENNNTKELIVINKKDISQIKQHYGMIQKSYIGRYEEMNNQIVSLEKEIMGLNNKMELQEKEKEIIIEKHKNELMNEKHKNELKDKDIEILNYKIKFLEK